MTNRGAQTAHDHASAHPAHGRQASRTVRHPRLSGGAHSAQPYVVSAHLPAHPPGGEGRISGGPVTTMTPPSSRIPVQQHLGGGVGVSRPSRAGRAAIEQRARLLELLKRLSPEVLEELDRRARFVVAPDGFGSATGSDGVRGSGVSRPVEAAVVARGERVVPDPVGEQIRNLFGALAEAAGVLGPASRWLDYLGAYGDRPGVARESSLQGDCLACGRAVAGTPQDRLKTGFCQACYEAWRRFQVGDRSSDPGEQRRRFVEGRRVSVVVERRVVVAAGARCGHVCCSRVVEHEHWHGPGSCPECASVSAGGDAA